MLMESTVSWYVGMRVLNNVLRGEVGKRGEER